ncbi:DUF4123 domain-containing protein [Oceanicola sp. D3]|uniref:DUF4123 domain-containing protein n=1 Tax=Oceanicola sp. D3 TaxID=2587163 RepID=UPI001122C72B|nr:DUF4123 domain-containing protein [Oceanicola sp. D3]QDC09485.1 DUF4123 domain-containing protein [Oceanicola sp. D3]
MIEQKTLSDGLPLGQSTDVDRKLPPTLERLLFTKDTRLFAVLDAARLPALQSIIENLELDSRCLFFGDLAESAGEAAPWLVELPKDCPLLFRLLTDAGPEGGTVLGHWRAEPGILLRTSGLDIDGLRRHLRRLMRVQDEDERWYFLRFWEPRSMATYLAGLTDRAETVARWVFPRETGQIDLFALPYLKDGTTPVLQAFRPHPDLPEERKHYGIFTLSERDISSFAALRWKRDCEGIAERLRATFPEPAEAHQGAALNGLCDDVMRRMHGYGLRHLAALFSCCAWELHFGPQFETRDPTGKAARILADDAPPELRFTRLSKHMEALEAQGAFNAA